MTARMLETVRKGYWKTDAETQFVMEQGRKAGIPVPALEGYARAMEKPVLGFPARMAMETARASR
jgi:cobalamin biosynthesis Mg chelatase CobN